ncbi:hypothetical protein [Clostridium estertheticum]|uniref:Uncharacterized protein n=1 Tax=Clostridium estertheticum subsp. estertheticum TaxID=1552 RepID=A0A1J0GIC2_9CLOT|nr:hypothetical protein [Clostridium estertheticum]APC41077.1 hypothetical protein A7L45_13835 [Clostridium estertheticum subsp. estertheticum]
MYVITDEEYLSRLKDQFDFLKVEFSEYEKGKGHFALKMAATLRTIFHKTDQSLSILPDLATRNGIEIYFKGKDQTRIDAYTSLYIGFTIGQKRPCLDAPFLIKKAFEDYWKEIVYVEGNIRYTRSQLVLWAANKLGGVHVDPRIQDKLLHVIDGSVKLVSGQYGEETIINQVVYEMACQVLIVLEELIPKLESTINNKS